MSAISTNTRKTQVPKAVTGRLNKWRTTAKKRRPLPGMALLVVMFALEAVINQLLRADVDNVAEIATSRKGFHLEVLKLVADRAELGKEVWN